MKYIKLSSGKRAIVDDDDFEYLSQFKWSYMPPNSTHYAGYAYRYPTINGKRTAIFMHRLINKTPSGLVTDHINNNKLDNRKKNLRTVTHSQNQMNTSVRKDNRLGVKGISYNEQWKKYRARIFVNGKSIMLGDFKNLRDAIAARKNGELQYHQILT